LKTPGKTHADVSFRLIALPYYETTNPELAGIARRSIEEVLADEQRDRSSGGADRPARLR